jgi:ATPase subunit of ABC transporter with duplicated ATPase domains
VHRFLCRYFPGPYDDYQEAKATAALTASRQIAALDKQKAHMQASIAAAEKQARQVGESKSQYALQSQVFIHTQEVGLAKPSN